MSSAEWLRKRPNRFFRASAITKKGRTNRNSVFYIVYRKHPIAVKPLNWKTRKNEVNFRKMGPLSNFHSKFLQKYHIIVIVMVRCYY